ncbi:MAG: carboxylesterase family protein [Sphaerochaeta sp.]
MTEPTPIVHTSLGTISGTKKGEVYSFKGIPYAQSLTPTTRFSPALPIGQWQGVFDASSYGPICPQKGLLRKKMGDNSLCLNIWTPITQQKLLPVLFFIHGGSFKQGAGSETFYEGSHLAKEGEMVVVSINYRLNIWGFCDFSSLDPSYTCNNGLTDVLLALTWVKTHIHHFGGDASRVTIMGQSAGGTMVSTLFTIAAAKPLFAQAIILSGGPTQLQSKDECLETSQAFLEYAEIDSKQTMESLSTQKLVGLQHTFAKKYSFGAATYRLTRDHNLVDAYPIPLALTGAGKGKPLLIGTTGEEMGFMAIKPFANLFKLNDLIEVGIALEPEHLRKELLDTYTAKYGEKQERALLYTDLLFRIASIWFAQACSAYSPTWMYRFDFETKALKMQGMHAVHASDLPYVFGNLENHLIQPMFLLDRDMNPIYAVAQEIQRDLTRFVHTGNLPWVQIQNDQITAKCYDEHSSIGPMVDPAINELYHKTEYYRRSMLGLGTFKEECND